MLFYGAEAWIFGPVRVGDDYRIRPDWIRLYGYYNDMDVAKRINIQRFRWFGHVVRRDEDAPPSLVFNAVVGDHRQQGRQRTRWKDHVEGSDFIWCDLGGRTRKAEAPRGRPKPDNRVVVAT